MEKCTATLVNENYNYFNPQDIPDIESITYNSKKSNSFSDNFN